MINLIFTEFRDSETLTLGEILNLKGLRYAIWYLDNISALKNENRLFRCACARLVLDIYESKYPGDCCIRNSIEVSEKYAKGECTKKELKLAYAAANKTATGLSIIAFGTALDYANNRAAASAAAAAASVAINITETIDYVIAAFGYKALATNVDECREGRDKALHEIEGVFRKFFYEVKVNT